MDRRTFMTTAAVAAAMPLRHARAAEVTLRIHHFHHTFSLDFRDLFSPIGLIDGNGSIGTGDRTRISRYGLRLLRS